jgi:hypothetical protein
VYPSFRPQRFNLRPERRKIVTICIAAITLENYLVTVSDTMLTTHVAAADKITTKFKAISKDWGAMMSADDYTQCEAVIDKAQEYLKGRANTLAVSRSTFKRAYQQHLAEMRADRILGGYGIGMETFLKSGKKMFTESRFEGLCNRMEEIRAGMDFIVYGYDGLKRPHIFRVSEGEDSVFDEVGFCSIGSGTYAADAMLYALEQSRVRTLPQTIFNLCAAKFTTEKLGGIGEHTVLHVKKPGSVAFSHDYQLIHAIRQSWEKDGKPRVPPGIVDHINGSGYTIL